MRVVLCDTSETICMLWRQFLPDLKGFIHHGRFSDLMDTVLQEDLQLGHSPGHSLGCAAVVSPGNSFGYLGGGFDLALYEYFGGGPFEAWFKSQLNGGYCPVGSASALDLTRYEEGLRKRVKYIIHTPTVVAPCKPLYESARPVETGYEPVFNAMWSALVHAPPDVDSLIVPGLCTGYVGVPAAVSCKSMAFALKLFFLGEDVSRDLKNALIMYFLGYAFGPFLPQSCLAEGEALGLDWGALQRFNIEKDSLDLLLPFCKSS